MPHFYRLEHPIKSPTCCLLCRSSAGPMIDTFQDRRGWGHVYICVECVTQMARCASVRRFEALSSAIRDVREEKRVTEEKLAAASKTYIAIDSTDDLAEKVALRVWSSIDSGTERETA